MNAPAAFGDDQLAEVVTAASKLPVDKRAGFLRLVAAQVHEGDLDGTRVAVDRAMEFRGENDGGKE